MKAVRDNQADRYFMRRSCAHNRTRSSTVHLKLLFPTHSAIFSPQDFSIRNSIDSASLVSLLARSGQTIALRERERERRRGTGGKYDECAWYRCFANKGLYLCVAGKREFTLYVEKVEDREVAVKHSRSPASASLWEVIKALLNWFLFPGKLFT